MFAPINFLLIFACLFGAAPSQDRVTHFMAGPVDGKIRVVIALTDPQPDGYKLQSMIRDLSRIKNADETPSFVQVDLTSTIRSLGTGAKQQKIFILHWDKSGQIKLKCDDTWKKHETNPGIDKVREAVKHVVRDIPMNAKKPVEVPLRPELAEEVSALFDALKAEDFPCLRELK